jgi:hypothetical protein
MHENINWADLSLTYLRSVMFYGCVDNEDDLHDYFQMMLM